MQDTQDWGRSGFQWSERVEVARKEVTRLTSSKAIPSDTWHLLCASPDTCSAPHLTPVTWSAPAVPPGQVFGLETFRPHQLAVINATMSGHDALLVIIIIINDK